MLYTGFTHSKPKHVGRRTLASRQVVKETCIIVPTIDTGDAWGERWNTGPTGQPDIFTRYDILEAIGGGAKGFSVCKWIGCTGLDFKYIAETINMLLPVEDIIMDGAPVVLEVSGLPEHTSVRFIKKGEEGLLLVSNYCGPGMRALYPHEQGYNEDAVTVEIPVPIPQAKVIDLDSGKTVPSGERCKVTLKKVRCKMFYVGNRWISRLETKGVSGK